MSQLNERGANSERNSALWGTGGRGGDRSSVLWGKGGRGMVVAAMVVALAAPLAATASKAKRPSAHARPALGQLAPVKKAKKAPAKSTKKAKHAPAKSAKKTKTAPVKTAKVTPTTSAPGTSASAAPVATPAPAVPQGADANVPDGNTYVAPGLITQAENTPDVRVPVIISSSGGSDAAKEAVQWLAKLAASSNQASDLQNIDLQTLDLVGGVSLSVPAKWLDDLQKVPGLIVTPNSMVKVSGTVSSVLNLKSTQLWPYESGNSALWPGDQAFYASKTPAIAIIDSGVQQRSDFGTRVIASVNLSTIPGNTSLDDERGHGTFVAGVAAGAAPDLTGAAPAAPIVSIKVMDKNGMAKTSDVINACQWILDNKAKYNIRVANFSLHSAYGTNFYRDPLDRAVEKLWFSDVVVVAASGNYGNATGPSGVRYSPGNDPFVITVGALDLGGSSKIGDDSIAPFSAYGYTYDGFYKPEIAAPGRYMVGPIPAGATITGLKPQNMVGTDRIQLSGTSFAAPVVAGTVAQMLARNPSWTPDQVKGALMRTARRVPINPKAAGVGEITATRAVSSPYSPNPNKGLERYLVPDTSVAGGLPLFDAQSWASAAKSAMSWNSMSWADQSWSDMSWADQSWTSMSWADQSWSDMSWSDMSWADMSWADVSQEDAAEGDTASGADGYVAPADAASAAANDPDLAVSVDPPVPAPLPPAVVTAPVIAAPAAAVPVPKTLVP
jgi:serine protease AprX